MNANTQTAPQASPPAIEKPWTMSSAQYQHQRGVHQPWIAEISPFQYTNLPKNQKRQYDAKRALEWDASAACKEEYAAAVVAAHAAGAFKETDADVSEDAERAIYYARLEVDEAAKKEALRVALEKNRVHIEDVKVGDVLFAVLGGGYVVVAKIFKHGLRVRNVKDATMKLFLVDSRACQWLHYNEVEEAVAGSRPFRMPTEVAT